MKKLAIFAVLVLLATQIHSLYANEIKKSDEVIVTTTFEAGPDLHK